MPAIEEEQTRCKRQLSLAGWVERQQNSKTHYLHLPMTNYPQNFLAAAASSSRRIWLTAVGALRGRGEMSFFGEDRNQL
jgi:hypothetical protein